MLAGAQSCAVGTKRNAKGYQESWIGYKLHIDAGDGGIPLSCILTSASVNDSQVAIPPQRSGSHLYDLMDAASMPPRSERASHCADHRCQSAQQQCHIHPRKRSALSANRTPRMCATGSGRRWSNGRLKDEFGARQVRVRGHSKVLPPDVRGTGVDRGPVAALGELKTRFVAVTYHRSPSCSPAGDTGQFCPRAVTDDQLRILVE